jgi:hypothetical protein
MAVRSFQRAMEQPFTEVVESALGRRVIAYMSQVHHNPNLAVEIFVLEPSAEPVGLSASAGPPVGEPEPST